MPTVAEHLDAARKLFDAEIAKAVLAEREACAQLAEGLKAIPHGSCNVESYDAAAHQAADEIAGAIRARL